MGLNMGEAMQSGGEKEVFLTPLLTGLLLHVSDGNVLRHVTGVVKSFPGVMRIAGAESPSPEEGDGDLQLKLFQIHTYMTELSHTFP